MSQYSSIHFHRNASVSLNNEFLGQAMDKAKHKFIDHRKSSITQFNEHLGDFEALREKGAWTRNQTIANWGGYLQQFSDQAEANGAQVHWALNVEEVGDIVVEIAKANQVQHIVKSKSMLTEEAQLNKALEANGYVVTETDLGEYILQLAQETPSHIIAPAVHKSREEVTELFAKHHPDYPITEDIPALTQQARAVLRDKFCEAQMGITGANFLVAETGSCGIVTNEGNGLLTSTLTKVRVVIAGIEKILPRLQDAADIVELLPRSATGQAISNYLTLTSKPLKNQGGATEQLHFVLVDAGRSNLLGTPYEEMLRCIRCGACMNHCPVYQRIGGHAYGWVYPGPMGSILTPLYTGLEKAIDLPHAATLCGQCEVVCPVKIPLPKLLRQLREDQVKHHLRPWSEQWFIRLWTWLSLHPWMYRIGLFKMRLFLKLLSGQNGIKKIPFITIGWFHKRHLPKPRD